MKIWLASFMMLLASAALAQNDTTKTVTIATEVGVSKDTVGLFEKVEIEASFPGGLPAWRSFLMQNLNAEAPFKEIPKRVKYFEQTAIVQFIVCTDGSICDVKVVNKVLPSIKKEAERVIKQSGNWEPAQQSGRKVKAYRKQPITFVVQSE